MRRIIEDTLLCFGAATAEKISTGLAMGWVRLNGPVDYDVFEHAQKLTCDWMALLLKLTVIAAARGETKIQLVNSDYSGAELWDDLIQTADVDYDFIKFADETLFSYANFGRMEIAINRILESLGSMLQGGHVFGYHITTGNLYHEVFFSAAKVWLVDWTDVDLVYRGKYGTMEMQVAYEMALNNNDESIIYRVNGCSYPEAVIEYVNLRDGDPIELYRLKPEAYECIK